MAHVQATAVLRAETPPPRRAAAATGAVDVSDTIRSPKVANDSVPEEDWPVWTPGHASGGMPTPGPFASPVLRPPRGIGKEDWTSSPLPQPQRLPLKIAAENCFSSPKPGRTSACKENTGENLRPPVPTAPAPSWGMPLTPLQQQTPSRTPNRLPMVQENQEDKMPTVEEVNYMPAWLNTPTPQAYSIEEELLGVDEEPADDKKTSAFERGSMLGSPRVRNTFLQFESPLKTIDVQSPPNTVPPFFAPAGGCLRLGLHLPPPPSASPCPGALAAAALACAGNTNRWPNCFEAAAFPPPLPPTSVDTMLPPAPTQAPTAEVAPIGMPAPGGENVLRLSDFLGPPSAPPPAPAMGADLSVCDPASAAWPGCMMPPAAPPAMGHMEAQCCNLGQVTGIQQPQQLPPQLQHHQDGSMSQASCMAAAMGADAGNSQQVVYMCGDMSGMGNGSMGYMQMPSQIQMQQPQLQPQSVPGALQMQQPPSVPPPPLQQPQLPMTMPATSQTSQAQLAQVSQPQLQQQMQQLQLQMQMQQLQLQMQLQQMQLQPPTQMTQGLPGTEQHLLNGNASSFPCNGGAFPPLLTPEQMSSISLAQATGTDATTLSSSMFGMQPQTQVTNPVAPTPLAAATGPSSGAPAQAPQGPRWADEPVEGVLGEAAGGRVRLSLSAGHFPEPTSKDKEVLCNASSHGGAHDRSSGRSEKGRSGGSGRSHRGGRRR